MSAYLTKLTVLCPRGQRPEVFRDPGWDKPWQGEWRRTVRVYSYEVLPNNVLKVYAYPIQIDSSFRWSGDDVDVDDGYEVAHFRPNQWDKVRSAT